MPIEIKMIFTEMILIICLVLLGILTIESDRLQKIIKQIVKILLLLLIFTAIYGIWWGRNDCSC